MCGEFCGLQHAHMHLRLFVEPAEQFVRWVEAQQRPASAPATPAAEDGQRIFADKCAQCHTIQGAFTGAGGPDLTHLASRTTLGAGIQPNTRDNLAGWTTNAQAMKPGNKMPTIPMADAELSALLDYLEGLR
jgi:cytochrome c oxidase subunit 2